MFTYAVDDDNTNELYAEFHLGEKQIFFHLNCCYDKASECVGRGAFRLCKKGTKFCAWMQGIPDFFEWIHICLAYDVFKDTYKIYKNGEKMESGSWSENPNVLKFHEFSKILNVTYLSLSDLMVFLYLVRIRTM